LKGYDS